MLGERDVDAIGERDVGSVSPGVDEQSSNLSDSQGPGQEIVDRLGDRYGLRCG
jgi:hypothetical protein